MEVVEAMEAQTELFFMNDRMKSYGFSFHPLHRGRQKFM